MAGVATFRVRVEDVANGASRTFANQPIGPAAADRMVVVAVQTRSNIGAGVNVANTGVEVRPVGTGSGVSLGKIIEAFGDSNPGTAPSTTSTMFAGIVSDSAVNSSNADIFVTHADTVLRCDIAIYDVPGQSAAAFDTATSVNADPQNANIDIPNNGVLIGGSIMALGSASASSCAITDAGGVEDYDISSTEDVNGTFFCGHHNNSMSAESARAITYDWTSGVTQFDHALVLASFAPAAHVLTAVSIASGVPSVGSPTLLQAFALTATSIATGAPSVGAPAFGLIYQLSALGIVSGAPSVGAPMAQALGVPALNYGDLKSLVQSWNWGRNVAEIPNFVRLAHSQINMRLRGTPMQATVDYTITQQRQAAPFDFQAGGGRLYLDTDCKFPLLQGTPDQIALINAQYPSGGQPLRYAIEGEIDGRLYFVFAPAPTQSYTGKLLYERRFPFFQSDDASNFVLQTWPKVYLYGSLREANLYAGDNERVAQFGALFDSEIGQVIDSTRRDQFAGAPLQMSSPYVV